MNRSKKRKNRLFPMLITVMVLIAVLTPAAYADTDGTGPKIVQQPDQLVLNEIYTQLEYATRRGREQAAVPAELPCGVLDDSLEERDACRELMGQPGI